jgi:protein-tyrosine-phosphatase
MLPPRNTPLFVCHANCARSVLAFYLYRHLTGADVLSAGMEAGTVISDKVEPMLRRWDIDAARHRATQLTRDLCLRATHLFFMGPNYLRRAVLEYGDDLLGRCYLFADPFTKPHSFAHGEYRVTDPSFHNGSLSERIREWSWMRERVLQIRLALLGEGPPLLPASAYLALLEGVDPFGQ